MSANADRASAINEESAQTYYQSGRSALEQGNLISGIALLTKAIALDDSHVDALLLRGQTLLQMGDTKAAAADLRRAMELNPQLLDGISGAYTAEGVEHRERKSTSNLNPFGL